MTRQLVPAIPQRLHSWVALALALALLATPVVTPTANASAASARSHHLSATEVARLFDNPLPALTSRSSVPAITGSRAADERIAEVALSRGYRYRGSPIDGLGTYQGRRLQRRAIDDLRDLQAAMAREAGVTLTLTSGHRGVASQRRIFRSRLISNSLTLRGRMVTNREIAQGRADDVLAAVMDRVAPPGFSKHHTGFAIDVASRGLGGFAFRQSRAFGWLTEDNYANAMRFGWIPSYPDGAAHLGPRPEPWEWVWIGRDAAECGRERSCAQGSLDGIGKRRRKVKGWAATPEGRAVRRLRVVTAPGTIMLDGLVPTKRYDVAAATGFAIDGLGFTVRVPVPRKAEWVCLEARTARREPWSRVDCLALGS